MIDVSMHVIVLLAYYIQKNDLSTTSVLDINQQTIK